MRSQQIIQAISMYIKMSLTSQTGTTCLSLETPRDWQHLCIKNKMDDIGYFLLEGELLISLVDVISGTYLKFCDEYSVQF